MNGIFIRWLTLTGAIIVTSYLLDGIQVSGFVSAFFAAAMLGILNALFRPILILLTLPINILTLGFFTFVINALMLKTASGVISGFEVIGFTTGRTLTRDTLAGAETKTRTKMKMIPSIWKTRGMIGGNDVGMTNGE